MDGLIKMEQYDEEQQRRIRELYGLAKAHLGAGLGTRPTLIFPQTIHSPDSIDFLVEFDGIGAGQGVAHLLHVQRRHDGISVDSIESKGRHWRSEIVKRLNLMRQIAPEDYAGIEDAAFVRGYLQLTDGEELIPAGARH
jgi:hypothetical protein